MKILVALALIGLVACAHAGPVDRNHDAPRAVNHARDVTNTGGSPLITNQDVQRAKNTTNTNVPGPH
jgi:hypothetical protein